MSQHGGSKIQSYKVLEAFVQCDFLDGFSYIDKAGEIVNGFVREKKQIPKFSMGLNGLVLPDISETIQEVRISSNTIWVHIVEPKNIGEISKDAGAVMERVLKVLKPTLYTRIGWRTYFAREDVSIDKLKLNKGLNGYELQNVVLARKLDEFQVRLEIGKIAHVTEAERTAVLFDVDLSKEIKAFTPKTNLQEIHQTLRSDDLFSTIEGLI